MSTSRSVDIASPASPTAVASPAGVAASTTTAVGLSTAVSRPAPAQAFVTSPAPPLLELSRVSRSFGGIRAVDEASFSVQPGTITGLIGPNGAGKSTVFNLVTGYLRPDSGVIRLRGEEITHLPPHAIVRRGVARTFQIPREIPSLTVRENLMLAPRDQAGELPWNAWFRRRQVQAEEQRWADRANEILALLQLESLADEYAGHLSGGQKKLLELGRALMQDATLILLDEPGAGVNPTLMHRLVAVLRHLREQGRTLVLIEHDMDLITRLCDWVVVMDNGRPLTEGTPAQVQREPRVLEAYLGVSA